MGRAGRRKSGEARAAGAAPPALPAGDGARRAAGRELLLAAAAVLGLLFYFAVFYRAPVLSPGGNPLSRGDVLRMAVDDLAHPAWAEGASPRALVDRLPVLGLAVAILATAAVAGWLLLHLMRAEAGLGRIERLVFSAAVGINVLSTAVLAIGLCGGLQQRWLFWLGGGVIWAAAAWRWYRVGCWVPCPRLPWACSRKREHGTPQTADKATGKETSGEPAAAWLWAVLPFVVVLILGAVLPPLDFDVREYHLQAPKEFYQAGRIGFVPHNVYANMPLGAEMLSLLAMVLSGDWWLGALAGKTAVALMTLLAALGVFALGRRWFSPAAGAIGAAVYLSVPWILDVSMAGLIDAAAGLYWLTAWAALLLWREARHDAGPDASVTDAPPCSALPRLLLAGYLAGAAVACKYPGLLFVGLPLGLAVAGLSFRGRGLAAAVGAVAIFVAAMAAGCGLWLAKNAVLSGNPTYPLLYNVFDGRTRTPEKDAQWNRVHRPHNFAPAALTADAGRVFLESPWLSPLVMPLAALAGLALLRPGWRGRAGPGPGARAAVGGGWLFFAWVFGMWWLLTHRIDRFWIPALPVLAILAGGGATALAHWLWRWSLAGVLLFGLAANLLTVTCGIMVYSDCRYFMPLATLRNDSNRAGQWRAWLNVHATQGRLLVVGDAQVLDYRMPVLYSTCFDTSPWEEIARGRTPAEIRAALRQRDVTYVYVDWAEIARYRRPGNYGITDFIQPELFESLVQLHILEPVDVLAESPNRVYRVLP